MPVEVIALFFGTLLSIGGIILAGQRMQYRHKERLADPEQMSELKNAVESLQEEVAVLRHASENFDERLEFTERLLSRPAETE